MTEALYNVILFFHTPLKSHAREKWSEALGFPSSRASFPRPLLFRGWGEAEMRVKEGIINQKNGGRFAHFFFTVPLFQLNLLVIKLFEPKK